jgi:uncharacterized membrane protein
MIRVTDKSLENVIGNLLRTGVLLAAAIVLIGGAMYLARSSSERVHFSVFQPAAPDLRSIAGIFHGAAHLESGAVIQLGVLLLIITPVARVALAVVGFFLEGDRLYTVVSAIVLAVLFVSLFGGK